MGLEIFPLLSHHATRKSLFHSLVRHFFIQGISSVCTSVSEKWLKVWCNVSVVSLKTIRRDYARWLTFLKCLFVEIRWDFCGDANKLSLAFLFSDHAIGLQFLKDVGLIRSKLQCNSCGRGMAWHAAPRSLHVCGEVHALGVSHFTQFLAIAAFTDWSSSSTERREMFKFFCESLSGKNVQTGRD